MSDDNEKLDPDLIPLPAGSVAWCVRVRIPEQKWNGTVLALHFGFDRDDPPTLDIEDEPIPSCHIFAADPEETMLDIWRALEDIDPDRDRGPVMDHFWAMLQLMAKEPIHGPDAGALLDLAAHVRLVADQMAGSRRSRQQDQP